MIINTTADHLHDLSNGVPTIIKELEDLSPSEVFEYLQPFLLGCKVDYRVTWLTDGNMIVMIVGGGTDRLKPIADYLYELLDCDYSEMNYRQHLMVKQLLNDVKCTFDVTKINDDLYEIRIYM